MKRVARILARRLAGIVPVAALVVVGTFLLLEAAPGDAVDAYLASSGGDRALVDELRRAWGLDGGTWPRLLLYLSALAHFDLGWSVAFARPVTDVIGTRIANTLLLMGLAVALAFFAGSLLGVLAGSRPGNAVDRFLSLGSLALYAVPGFWLGLVLIVVFSVRLQWLPTGGIGTWKHWVMPVLAYSLAPTAVIARYTRVAMLEVTNTDYIRTARAKGLHERTVIGRHAFKNALIPLLTIMGPLAATMVTGSFFIETIFRIPGMGNQLTLAIYNRDYPVIMTLSLLWSTVIAVTYLVTDLLYAWIDPRVRLTGR